MSYRGFYKRRRAILEHLESGRISLLDAAVHDQLCLRANPIVGNDSYAPPGVWIGSAKAIHATCPRQVSELAVRRSLSRLEGLGWIKRFRVPGKHGNYPILLARFSVTELLPKGRKEYLVNAKDTTDWKHPVLVPVNPATDQPETSQVTVKLLIPSKEVRTKTKKERKILITLCQEGFKKFWQEYPRKEAKQKAADAWKKIEPKEVPEIMAGLERLKSCKQWRDGGGKFIPHPATFLNGRRWEDTPNQPRTFPIAEPDYY